ncbi:unnamed protein product [Heterobilharzia americana]|nr:unnamed protein product [Heterobilharzia americana]
MKSLLEANDKILPKDSKLKGLIKTPKILNEKQNNGRELSLFDASKQNVCDILTSDDDELIDLYGVRSECPAFFEDYVSSSSFDSNRIPKSSKKHQWNETKNKSSFPPQKIIPATKEQVCTSSSSDNEDFDARKISSKGKTSFSMKKYLSQLENELKGEPANIGRYIPGTHKSSIRTKLSAYKRGLCSAKKPRGNIQLAQPEDTSFTFDMTSCDSDDFLKKLVHQQKAV